MLRRCRELGGPALAPPAGRGWTAHRWDPHRRAGHVRPPHAGRAGARGQRGSVAGGGEGARPAPESTSSGMPSKTVSVPRHWRFWTCSTGCGRMCRGRSCNRRYACSRPPSATTGVLGGNCRRCPAAGRSRRRTCWQRSDRRLASWAGRARATATCGASCARSRTRRRAPGTRSSARPGRT